MPTDNLRSTNEVSSTSGNFGVNTVGGSSSSNQFENLTTASNESLDKAYDRFQKLISQLEVPGAPVSKEDINQKFLRSLPHSWSQITLIMRNKPDIDQVDIDDLYNNLRVYKDEMKRSSSSTSNSQNLAFLSFENTSSTNEVSSASGNFGVNTAGGSSSSNQVSSTPGADEVVCSFFAHQATSPLLDNEDLQQIDQDDLEKLDIRQHVAMLTVRVQRFVKKRGKIKKQKARKGIHVDKTTQDETKEEREAFMKDKVTSASSESEIGIDAIPTATKPHSIVDWKIIPQTGQKAVYQIIRSNGTYKIYMSFGVILKDFSRDDLTELYRLVIKKYGANRPEEMYDRVLWGDLKTMFDPPLSDDAIWGLPLQQKMINWRYYPSCAVHCLTLEASTIYMLADRKYPLSKDACQVMLKMKLLDGTMDEVCYQLLKMIEKQAGLRL
ncbi:hypothetical protein Tco_0628431 [Tanacetum coccineum]|uniref:Uncharacterized protein n=1 Tax=Tanacetum coccineum TaxID=301880 RepID=A0ABQ4WQA8_9ASTR